MRVLHTSTLEGLNTKERDAKRERERERERENYPFNILPVHAMNTSREVVAFPGDAVSVPISMATLINAYCAF